ncbi:MULTISPECIES: YebC/PmpR family DNA-binding transcriptional regulator [unclassified Neptuniibacter]|jgi:YebC/PmpR family DNA-binding regulatory protein|uniref:YebC/PmpR family DNA-binding transcriptional regulator n=1 Tax=unclassified Neptuniibacter TaxID=2630693 RepID=UPI0026E20442|nr:MULTISPECIES: YebC/PmpR family DNA-binding transcriptional regulator [unclassified Neptuniibacter]MDO6515343.1 YebC/PmpR family DNA-binding transcriptional regulator [Neptuniibacter sp. 2_MG-2023]MDO6592292.1 YebC/PmpR family DNA-binding transcriptional regulator [Neptuniibacter sp. 1_MG-2023]
MAGHSKFANIKHRKAAQDAKRGKVFTKLIRELVVAAKEGGGNPDDNPRLRAAVDKGLGANMKRDTIDKAILRGAGGAEGDNYDELTYEGYGANGVAILVECMTDNVNRTVAGVRAAFNKFGGNLGTSGSVAYLFEKKGQITFGDDLDEEVVMEAALEAGAEDVVTNDDNSIDVFTDWHEFMDVKQGLEDAGLQPVHAEIAMIPSTTVELDVDAGRKVLKLIDALEDFDDSQNVYHNAIIPEESMDE